MARHFACTACGKCCTGVLPLTVDEAFAHATRFPLAMAWMPVRRGGRAFEATAALGLVVDLPGRLKAAVRVTPVCYVPKNTLCPQLTETGLCGIHDIKPLRCKAMPFMAWRDEADQADLLIPRPGWACDVSSEAPAVYDAKTILDRADFDAERAALEAQAPVLRAYAQALLPMAAGLPQALAAATEKGGTVYLGFSGLLRRIKPPEMPQIAAAQLEIWEKLAGGGEYGKHAAAFADESRRLAAR